MNRLKELSRIITMTPESDDPDFYCLYATAYLKQG